jgi:predicted nucleic acid-binding protein
MVIDTGIFIEHLRAKDKTITTLYKLSDNSVLYISSVSVYELYMGATSKEKWKDVQILTEGLIVLPFSSIVATKAAQIYHQLKLTNQLIEFRDILSQPLAL